MSSENRFVLNVFPRYPTASSAVVPTPAAYVAQVKRKLIADGNLDTVEAALLGPTDAATISWTAGGPVALDGPLSSLIAATLGYDTATMTAFLQACAAITL